MVLSSKFLMSDCIGVSNAIIQLLRNGRRETGGARNTNRRTHNRIELLVRYLLAPLWYFVQGLSFRYLLSPLMAIDLVAVLPTVLRLLSIPLGFGGFSLEFLRLLRVLRFQRFLNNVRNSSLSN